jgi:hypothetical protein
MVHAIAICERVDEVKDIRDKAVALEAYAKQANNHEAERQCGLIRVRAERKCGQMLADREKPKGNRHVNSRTSEGTMLKNPTLAQIGITPDQSSTWQKLANVPEEEFEKAAARPGRVPKAAAIIKETNPDLPNEPMPRMHPAALDWWGWLNRMESGGWLDLPIDELLSEMTDNMRRDAVPKLEILRRYLNAK